MKFVMVFLLIACPLASAEETSADPLNFAPATRGSEQNGEWVRACSAELSGLLRDAVLAPRALQLGAGFCRDAVFPADPLSSARQVFVLLARTDFLIRSGFPVGRIKTINVAAWRQALGENGGALSLEAARAAVKDIRKEANAAEKTAAKFAKKADKAEKAAAKIDKIKEKK